MQVKSYIFPVLSLLYSPPHMVSSDELLLRGHDISSKKLGESHAVLTIRGETDCHPPTF